MRTVTARIGRVGVLLLALLVPVLTGCAPPPEVRPPVEDRYRPDDHYRLAQLYLDNRSYLLAEQEIKQALALKPDDPRYLELLALTYQAQGMLQALRADRDRNLELLTLTYQSQGRLQLAEEAYKQALQKPQPPPSVLVNYGTLLLLFGRVDEAITFIQRALRDPRYNRPALAYTNMGLAYFKKGVPPRAIEQFRIALEYQSNLPEAHYNLGLVYAQTGELDKAIRAFQDAVRYRPSYVEAQASLGAALLETGRQAEARAAFERVVALGAALLETGRQEEARAAFERVIALAPDSDMATASRKQLQHLTP